MRTFLPLTASDLAAGQPPEGRRDVAVHFTPPADVTGEALEELAEDALADAAFNSLQLVLDGGDRPARIVAVSDEYPQRWDQIECFQVDGQEVEVLIAAAADATTQEQLDVLAEEIMAAHLEWFDISELQALRRRFDV